MTQENENVKMQINNNQKIESQSSSNLEHVIQQKQLQNKELQQFLEAYQNVMKGLNIAQSIKIYSMTLIRNQQKDDSFMNHCMENKFIKNMLSVLQNSKYNPQIVKSVFYSLQLMLRGFKNQTNEIYLIVTLSQSNFINSNYIFNDEDDAAYYAHFLKILVRKIIQNNNYLNVFFNIEKPNFPLLFNLLKFYNYQDISLNTSVKLTIIQLCQNPNPLLQKYTTNFPFVLFYNNYNQIIKNQVSKILSSKDADDIENLIDHLKYIQEFLKSKTIETINMYSNAFFSIVIKHLFEYLLKKQCLPRVLQIIYTLMKQISSKQIIQGLIQIFNKTIKQSLLKYLNYKANYLDKNYNILSQCQYEINQHCLAIFYPDQNRTNKSIMKFLNSYIPHTNSNWLYYQLKKLSQIIGVNVEIQKAIDHTNQNTQSYLYSLYARSEYIQNQIYTQLIKSSSQQSFYWYLKICQLADIQYDNKDFLEKINLQLSFSVLRQFYKLILIKNFFIEDSTNIIYIYNKILQQLVYIIMGQGWENLYKKNLICSNNDYSHDAKRDNSSQVIYFIIIRHLLGVTNQSCSDNLLKLEHNDKKFKEIKVFCYLNNEDGQEGYLILDRQYLKLYNSKNQLLSQQPLLIRDYSFYNTSNLLQLVNTNFKDFNKSYSLCFANQSLCQYIHKQLKVRKEAATMFQVQVKTFKFNVL